MKLFSFCIDVSFTSEVFNRGVFSVCGDIPISCHAGKWNGKDE
jgi:hypothetical protein